jgi:hypothetical protein
MKTMKSPTTSLDIGHPCGDSVLLDADCYGDSGEKAPVIQPVEDDHSEALDEDVGNEKELNSIFSIPSRIIHMLAPIAASEKPCDDVETPPNPKSAILTCCICNMQRMNSESMMLESCSLSHSFCRSCLAVYVNALLERCTRGVMPQRQPLNYVHLHIRRI